MNSVDVALFKTESAKILKRAQKEAITVTQDGKPEVVMISPELYEHYEKLEDAYWTEKIAQRSTEGQYLSNEESLSALKSVDLVSDAGASLSLFCPQRVTITPP